MGWVAAGCCTLIAGCVLYKFVTQHSAGKGLDDTSELAGTTPARNIEEEAEKVLDSAPRTILQISSEEGTISGKVPQIHTSLPEAEEHVASVVGKMERTAPKPLQVPQLSGPAAPPATTQARSSIPPRLNPPTFATPPGPGNGLMRPPPSAAASLRVPPTKVLPNASMAPTSSIMPPGKQVSRKVILEPGHSPLDWAALTSNPNSRLRGKDAPENLIRVTPARLKQQNGRKGRDAWTVYNGKVYNITPYVPFHPGGKGEILRGAGKDSVKLFMEVHPWVNWDAMLSECLVGILVADEEELDNRSGGLDDMD